MCTFKDKEKKMAENWTNLAVNLKKVEFFRTRRTRFLQLWEGTHDMWHVTCDTWHATHDTWQVGGGEQSLIINRPVLAGAVLQTASSLINLLIHPFPPNLQHIINPKPLELGSWNFERMFTPHHVSCVICHASHVRCHVSCVMFFFFSDRVVELVGGGSVINGAYPV